MQGEAAQAASRPAGTRGRPVVDAAGFGLTTLRSPAGVVAEILPSGALFALRHGPVLLNQFLPGPAEDGLFRLLLRWHEGEKVAGWASLVGAGRAWGAEEAGAAWDHRDPRTGLAATATLELHPEFAGWTWRVRLENHGDRPRHCDVLLAQDLGLGDAGAVRNNEAYVSQYLDLSPLEDPALGPVVCARQNQPVSGGRNPWLAVACLGGAAGWCTDGWQFFGGDHRLTGEPRAMREQMLPSRRLQFEFALAGLQSRRQVVEPGAAVEVQFLARFVEDHPDATGPGDLVLLREMLPGMRDGTRSVIARREPVPASIFVSAGWLHGRAPGAADWEAWFPGDRRHEERDAQGRLLSFFHGESTHVVAQEKEAAIERPHGHILRSGDAREFDSPHLGLTCYAAGIFGAQAYLDNPGVARWLSVVRNPLNLARAGGQRLFVRAGKRWQQLGVPSAFALEPGGVRWFYALDDGSLEIAAWCSASLPASFLRVEVRGGEAREFLVTHQLALGGNEFDGQGRLLVAGPEGWIGLQPDPEGFLGKHLPGRVMAIAAAVPGSLAALGGEELLHEDGRERPGPYAVLRTRPVPSATIMLVGTADGPEALGDAVAAARDELAIRAPAAVFPVAPVRLRGGRDPGVARIDEILPWYAHNAAIHFSAPHGLEQYGGGAWGVRDVTQGSLEWLLAAGEHEVVKRMLRVVFAQQYHDDGSWPQWFMFPPFAAIQQPHSHGDVCLWPVKALGDYVEATNDVAFLDEEVGYTCPERFAAEGAPESLWRHVDRVVAHCEARFVAGTALVDYGDGDWDDTLQPADPGMRTRMVSSWTVALASQTLGLMAGISRRAGHAARAEKLAGLVTAIRRDFAGILMPEGVTAGFVVSEPDGIFRALLHPSDGVTGIRYRLLPMTRAIIAGLFTPEEARRHAALIEAELRFPDGVRLMSEPVPYGGGRERWFKRADTAANVGREIGLQYVHAHLRYAEAMARLGEAERLWWALQVVNPVGLAAFLPGAASRQANVYFSSSDAGFADRYEAAERWGDLRAGRIPFRAGWRLYSSGPGLFLHKVRSCLLGLRESFEDVVIDPVLPAALDGLVAAVRLEGRDVEIRYRVRAGSRGVSAVKVNGSALDPARREANPYREGGLRVARADLVARLRNGSNMIEVDL